MENEASQLIYFCEMEHHSDAATIEIHKKIVAIIFHHHCVISGVVESVVASDPSRIGFNSGGFFDKRFV